MKPSSISQIQKELTTFDQPQLIDVCMRLAKYKKENKELLSYLLFEAYDENKFIANVKTEVDDLFNQMNTSTMYFTRKSVRKIVRYINKFIKYSGLEQTEIELRIYFCQRFKSSGIPIHKSETLINLYNNQVEKIKKTLDKLHEDLQFDYLKEVEQL